MAIGVWVLRSGGALYIYIIAMQLLPQLGAAYDLEDDSRYTNTWVVEFTFNLASHDVDSIADKHGFLSRGKVFTDSNHYEFHHPLIPRRSLNHSHELTRRLNNSIHVRYAEQQIARPTSMRSHYPEESITLIDPLWHSTWYLNRGINNSFRYDMNVISAWKKGFTGKGIVVSVVDNGLEHTHPDLVQNYDPLASYDFISNDGDPTPVYDISGTNRHGTRCAGVVAASANNSYCTTGVAYDAKLGGIRMLDRHVTDLTKARTFSYQTNHIDIYSCSWGPINDGKYLEGPGTLTKQAFINAAEKGRHGKGNIIVWAAGNGGQKDDSCACDGYASSMYTLSVTSASEYNRPAAYLEQCSSTLVTTYSSSGYYIGKEVVTTDLRNQCTLRHSGTSASTPMAAGIIALALQSNPRLTWRDVQYLTLATANPEPLLEHGDFLTNSVGRLYSHKFGYGLMDAGRMVEMASDWGPVLPQRRYRMPVVRLQRSLNSTYHGYINVLPCQDKSSSCIKNLEHVQLVLTMKSTQRGKLSVKLTSPRATESVLLRERTYDYTSLYGFVDWPFLSVHFWGENPVGTWKFEVQNGGLSGVLSSYQLLLYGLGADPFGKTHNPPSSKIVCHETCANISKPSEACFGPARSQCKLCRADLLLVQDTRMCVRECPAGYNINRWFKRCDLCYERCSACANKLLLNSVNSCVKTCPLRHFADLSASLCRPCHQNCSRCISSRSCLECDGELVPFYEQCLPPCKPGQYRKSSVECVSCRDPNCSLCTDEETCTECNSMLLYKGACTVTCPTAAYTKGKDCFDCYASCATCKGKDARDCLSCRDGYRMTPYQTCISNRTCPDGQFRRLDTGNCEDCDKTCYTCHGRGLACTSCTETRYLKDGACVTDCGKKQFPFTNKLDGHRSCQYCAESCSTCVSAEASGCTSCYQTTVLNPDNHLNYSAADTFGDCVATCPNGTRRKQQNFKDDRTGFVCRLDNSPACKGCQDGGSAAAHHARNYYLLLCLLVVLVPACIIGVYLWRRRKNTDVEQQHCIVLRSMNVCPCSWKLFTRDSDTQLMTIDEDALVQA